MSPPVTWLRLLPVQPPPPTSPPTAVAPEAPAVRAARSSAKRPAAETPAPGPPPAAAPELAPAPQAITLPPPAPPTPLILALPPSRAGSAAEARAPALRDPRANSRPTRGATDALRALAGDPRLREETLAGEGRRRVHAGGGCVEVHTARAAQLDPFNQSVSPLPAQIRPCD